MPYIERNPGHVKPGSVNTDIIGNIDFAPTFLDLANIPVDQDAGIQDRSFASILMGNTPDNWREALYYHYYEFPYWHHVQPHYGIRTDLYTLAHFYYNVDKWELYDNQKDPKQMHNGIDDPEYADVVQRLKQKLKEQMKKYGDAKSLEDFRRITDKEFGEIVGRKIIR